MVNDMHEKTSATCKAHFLIKDTAIKSVWAALIVVIGLSMGCVGWAWTQAVNSTAVTTQVTIDTKRIDRLESVLFDINGKLDRLLIDKKVK